MPDTEIPTRKRRTRVVKPKSSSMALDEIDRRLAEALSERTAAIANVSKLVYWQDRLTRVNQEIDSLIGFQQRLTGKTVTTEPRPADVQYTSTGVPFVVGAGVPPGVTSVPTRQPAPSGTNVAETIGSETGFS